MRNQRQRNLNLKRKKWPRRKIQKSRRMNQEKRTQMKRTKKLLKTWKLMMRMFCCPRKVAIKRKC